MTQERRQTKAEQRDATMHKLVQIGRTLFAECGYAETAAEEIVQRAGVTRGALYHHFGSKEGLFKAVLDAIQRDVAQRVETAANALEDPWEQLVAGCHAFLTAALEPDVQRIMLLDAPAVLGWDVWRQMDAVYSMKALHEGFSAVAAAGIIRPLPLDALVHLLSGAMNEAALWIARAEQPTAALADATVALTHLLESLRRTST